MKTIAVLSLPLLLCVFAAGCAAEAEGLSTPQEVEVGDDALRRATVVGKYVRKVHASGCNLARTLELKSDGSYLAELSYSGPGLACASMVAAPQIGRFTVNSTNRVTFKPDGRRGSFTLDYGSGVFRGVTSRSSTYRLQFGGSFQKLGPREACIAQSDCTGMNYCAFPVYAPGTPAHVFPPVVVGTCMSPLRYCNADAGEACPGDEVCVYIGGRSDGLGFCRSVD